MEKQPDKPEPTVSARQVLQALSEVRRRKVWPIVQELEKVEPDLMEFVIEEISAVHQTLLNTGASPDLNIWKGARQNTCTGEI